jgi:D-alanine-D-alanine ligase
MGERFIDGPEYTAAILDGRVLPLLRIETRGGFYDYHAKYETNDTRYHCPCGLPEDEELRLAKLCKRAFTAVGARGWGRVDFMLDNEGQPWFLEINTAPGMTSHSLVPMCAAAAGIDFDELVWRILIGANTAGEARHAAG